MPVVRRRRTRSRRTTRRLHRTRRHRGQRGGAARMDLSAWKEIVNEIKSRITEPTETLTILATDESKNLKDERLTLTAETAPDISILTMGKSEGNLSSLPTAQTLLAAIANIMLITGEQPFANAPAFQATMKALKENPMDEFDQGRGVYNFIQSLETFIRDSTTPVDILDSKNYPLYVWFAAANFDSSKSEESSAPLLEEAPTQAEPVQKAE